MFIENRILVKENTLIYQKKNDGLPNLCIGGCGHTRSHWNTVQNKAKIVELD